MPNNNPPTANTPVTDDTASTFARAWYRFFTTLAQKANLIDGSFSTSATAGSATALPATPAGYMTILDDSGATKKVPYYNE